MARKREERSKERMIPIAKPHIDKKELRAVSEVLRSGWLTQGQKVKEFEDAFKSYVGSRHACAVSSCTTALHLALLAVGVRPGDVVITVSHSFIATANSIRYCGAEPVFVDIDLGTFNISTECLKAFLDNDCANVGGKLFYKNVASLAVGESPLRYFIVNDQSKSVFKLGRVAAILAVHQMGMPCELSSILPLARRFNLPIVEDAACAIGSEIKIGSKWEKIGKPHGEIACFSFHPRKILTTGEGGMITTNNSDYDRKIRLLRQHGMSASDLIRHKAKKVIFEEYVTTGYNYRMTDIQAAIGIEQLKKIPFGIRRRREISGIYRRKLSGINWLELPKEPYCAKSNWQSYPVRVRDNAPLGRNKLMQYLLDAGISTRRGIMNAHQELPYKSPCWKLPVSEIASDYTFLLPIFISLPDSQIEHIVTAIKRLKR